MSRDTHLNLVGMQARVYLAGSEVSNSEYDDIEYSYAVADDKINSHPEDYLVHIDGTDSYHVEKDIVTFQFTFVGDSFDSVMGGIHYEVGNVGVIDTFERWLHDLAVVAKKTLAEHQQKYPSNEMKIVNLVLAFTYETIHHSSPNGEEWDSAINLLGIVELGADSMSITPWKETK